MARILPRLTPRQAAAEMHRLGPERALGEARFPVNPSAPGRYSFWVELVYEHTGTGATEIRRVNVTSAERPTLDRVLSTAEAVNQPWAVSSPPLPGGANEWELIASESQVRSAERRGD